MKAGQIEEAEMALVAEMNRDGDVEVRDDGLDCSIVFPIHLIRGGMASVPADAVVASSPMSESDPMMFVS